MALLARYWKPYLTIDRPKGAVVLVASLVLASLLGLLAGCAEKVPAEQRLRDAIAQMQEALESGDRAGFMDRVDENFGGQRGQFDHNQLNQILRVQMLRHANIGSTITNLQITLFEGRASATMQVLVRGGARSWMPENADFITINSGWVDSGKRWQLISADWQ